MNRDDRGAVDVLDQASAQPKPARRPDAPPARRSRWRLVAAVAGVAALVALVAIPLAWALRSPTEPAETTGDSRSIPAEIRAPKPLQPNLVDSPNGPASVIVTGGGGFDFQDLFLRYDDRAVVVGRDGLYRNVRHINAFSAGEDLLLSPDGRYLAGGPGLEGVDWGSSSVAWQSAAAVMDLTTGAVRVYHEGSPIAWSPDGRLLAGPAASGLTLIDPGTDATVSLGIGAVTAVAFSPDGDQLAVQRDRQVDVVDVDTRAVREVAVLDAEQSLAGPGAWRADGRLAVWDRTECAPGCPTSYSGFRLSYMDINDGSTVEAGFDPVRAVTATVLGFQSDGDAVVVLAMTEAGPDGPHVGAPQVLALHPQGGQTTLITVTDEADRIDIARNLLDNFGGESPSSTDELLDVVRVRLPQVLIPIGAIALLVAAGLVYRRVRDGVWPWLPREFRRARR